MLISEEDAKDLKVWVMKKLEDISDADSDVLADYVLALVRTDVPNTALRESTVIQLEDFLHDNAAGFVDELFQVVDSRAFTSRRPAAPLTTQQPAIRDAGSNPPAAARMGTVSSASPSLPNKPTERKRRLQDTQGGERYTSNSVARGDGRSKRGRRAGNTLQNSHGIADDNGFASGIAKMQASNPLLPGLSGSSQFKFPAPDPQSVATAMLMLQSMGMSLPLGVGSYPPGSRERCIDYNTKGFCVRGASCTYNHGTHQTLQPQPGEYDPKSAGLLNSNTGLPAAIERAGNRPRIPRSATRKKPQAASSTEGLDCNRSSNSLVVEQIPEQNLDEQQILDFFGPFGPVEEVTVQADMRLAIVAFSTREAAQAAYESPKAIFDNRFVKLCWYDPEKKANGSNGQLSTLQDWDDTAEVEFDRAKFEEKIAEAQRKYEERIKLREETESKSLELELQRLKIEKELWKARKEVEERLRDKGSEASQATLATEDSERREETHRRINALRAQVTALEAEARGLGLDPEAMNGSYFEHEFYGPYRGRGSYRGAHRGRYSQYHHPSRGANRGTRSRHVRPDGAFVGAVQAGGKYNLDLRPKRILLKTADGGMWSEVKEEFLCEHLFSIGEFDVVETVTGKEDGDAIISFKDRSTAEIFYYGPREVPGVGKFNLTWVANPQKVAKEDLVVDGDIVMVDEEAEGVKKKKRYGNESNEYDEGYDVAEVDERWIV